MGFQIWDVLEGGHLFHGTDPEHDTYRSRAHLAEMIALLGPPPPGLVARGSLRFKFFSEQGQSPSPARFFVRAVLTLMRIYS